MQRWNPWRALRERDEIKLEWRMLNRARGLWIPHADGTSTIALDIRLNRRQRRCVLAHELVHAERGLAYTASTPTAMIQLEERIVRREAARRLVPPDELLDLADRLDVLELWDICDHFDVDAQTGREASHLVQLHQLAA